VTGVEARLHAGARRNLHPDHYAYYRGKLSDQEKKQPGKGNRYQNDTVKGRTSRFFHDVHAAGESCVTGNRSWAYIVMFREPFPCRARSGRSYRASPRRRKQLVTEYQKRQSDGFGLRGSTSKQIAREHGVSQSTVERDAAFARGVDIVEEAMPGAARLS
jgi:hypothetical protein